MKGLPIREALELLHARTLALENICRQTPPPYSNPEGKLARAALAGGPDSSALARLVNRQPPRPRGLLDTDKPLVPHLRLWQKLWTCLSQRRLWRQARTIDRATAVLWRMGEDESFERMDQLGRQTWEHLYRRHLPRPPVR